MYKIGMSSCDFPLTEENFAALNENKISAVEISMQPELYKDIDYKQLKNLSEKYAVELWSYHFPFLPFSEIDISFKDKAKRESTVGIFRNL